MMLLITSDCDITSEVEMVSQKQKWVNNHLIVNIRVQ